MRIGHSDSASDDTCFLMTTIHHNWFDGTMSRHLRLRFGGILMYNNLYLNTRLIDPQKAGGVALF